MAPAEKLRTPGMKHKYDEDMSIQYRKSSLWYKDTYSKKQNHETYLDKSDFPCLHADIFFIHIPSKQNH